MQPANVIRLDPTQEDAIRNNRCYMGGEQVFYNPVSKYDEQKASGPGHIYSETGLREYRLSGACEYHFDELAQEAEDPESGVFRCRLKRKSSSVQAATRGTSRQTTSTTEAQPEEKIL
jgi:hypothetical protein